MRWDSPTGGVAAQAAKMAGVNPTAIAEALRAMPMHEFDALATGSTDRPPAVPGFYSWWQKPGALPSVPGTPHPSADLELLYLGIAPANATSQSNLRKRLRQHHGAAIGTSTFRRALTAFLWEPSGWSPYLAEGKVALAKTDLAMLSTWQRENLSVQWIEATEPWTTEAAVIELLQPPLNSHHNHGHEFFPTLNAARSTLIKVARATST